MFVAVVSPSYLQSPFCMQQELKWYQSHGGKFVIQLVKVPLEPGDLEVPLPQSHYVKLHDAVDERPLTGKKLETALSGVVRAVREKLRECRNARPKIFVAQVRDDAFKTAWTALKERLHEDGYAVLPQEVLIGGVPESRIQEMARGVQHLDSLGRPSGRSAGWPATGDRSTSSKTHQDPGQRAAPRRNRRSHRGDSRRPPGEPQAGGLLHL